MDEANEIVAVNAGREVRDMGRGVGGADRAELDKFVPSAIVGPVIVEAEAKEARALE